MEHGLWLSVLGVAGLLTLAVLFLPLSRRLHFPFTVMLAAVGVLLGLFARAIPPDGELGVIGDLIEALRRLDISSEEILFVFLPALVFESALAIDVRRLLDDIAPILALAVLGLLFSTAVVGLTLWQTSGTALLVCLLLGAIVSATDPVAVVAIFKDLGAPKRLAILVEGESLFNDATAIVLFGILSAMLLARSQAGLASGFVDFLQVFVGGIAVGLVLARAALAVVRVLGDAELPKITLTLGLAYLSFIVAEHYLHVSGVMAVVTAALVLGSRGRTLIPPSQWHGLEQVWEQIGFVANSVIFILVGFAAPSLLGGIGGDELLWLAALIAAALAARFAIVFGMLPLLTRAGLGSKVSAGYRAVMFWGGLRGAVSLALALAVMENPAFDRATRDFIGVLVTGFVLFTLAINATTVQRVMRAFGLHRLGPGDLAVRNRVLAAALSNVDRRFQDIARRHGAHEALVTDLMSPVRRRAEAARRSSRRDDLSEAEWQRIGLRMLVLREKRIYRRLQEDGLLDADVAGVLFRHASDLLDAARAEGAAGYQATAERFLSYRVPLRLAVRLQRHLGWPGPLARALSLRFRSLRIAALALRELGEDTGFERLGSHAVGAELEAVLAARTEHTRRALEALTAAYPDYAAKLDRLALTRTAVRLEELEYREMLEHSVIGEEIHRDLVDSLHGRLEAQPRPRLDLGLDAERLLGRVPFLAALPEARRRELAAVLRPRLALPGERILTRGDEGDAMYFISSGAVRVPLETGPVVLGSGDFFGEMALVSDQPRVVDVVAEGFCDLLVLLARDFHALMARHPELRETIERVAASRTTPGA